MVAGAAIGRPSEGVLHRGKDFLIFALKPSGSAFICLDQELLAREAGLPQTPPPEWSVHGDAREQSGCGKRCGPQASSVRCLTMNLWLSLLFAIACLALGLGGCTGGRPLASGLDSSIALELEQALRIPEEWVVRDIVADERNEVVLQVGFPERVIWVAPDTVVIPVPQSSLIGTRLVSEGLVQVLNRSGPELLTITRKDGVIQRDAIVADPPLWDAVFIGSAWYVVAGDSLGPPQALVVAGDGRILDESQPVIGLRSSLTQTGDWAGRPVLGEIVAPFRIFDPFGDHQDEPPHIHGSAPFVFMPPASSDATDIASSSMTVRNWGVALPTLALDSMALLTLVDPISTRRLIYLVSQDGLRFRSKEVDVPLSFTHTTGRVLVGLRHTDITEVVKYRWRWK